MIDATAQRILRFTAGNLTFVPVDSTGEAADPGVVTVGVVASDGTTVIAAGTATTGTTSKAVAYTVTHSALCDVWTATWKLAGVTIGVTTHEVVGGVYFTIAELRAAEPSLSDVYTYTAADLQLARREVETVFESHMNVAQVPRFSVIESCLSNGSTLITDVRYPRRVAWCNVYSSDTDFTALTADECADLILQPGGMISRSSGWYGRVRLGVEHGKDAPSTQIKRAAMQLCRYIADRPKRQATPSQSWMTTDAGATVGFAKPNPTDLSDVNVVLNDPNNRWPIVSVG